MITALVFFINYELKADISKAVYILTVLLDLAVIDKL